MKETSLYPWVKEYLERRGFTVRSEVRDCDIVAIKDEQVLIVELKSSFNLDLALQGLERKRICDDVYIAIMRPKNLRSRRWHKILRLCKALGLGVMLVLPSGAVDVISHSQASPPRKLSKEKNQIIKEALSRSGDYNLGGSTRRPLVTAYRERALRVAQDLKQGPGKIKDIVEATKIKDAGTILQRDYYGWFERVERGIYRLTPKGLQSLIDYADVLK